MTFASTAPLVAGYRIEELAARGGMGLVYRATQLTLGRPVALKLISPPFADDLQFRARFKRESELAASIDHPNVIPVYEAGENDGCLFISMRWVEGADLNTVIKRGGGLAPERAAVIVSQVGAALDAAHARGLLHRDVKPGNILVADDPPGHVYLTDFGLVKRVGDAELTRSGELLGTVDYVAPEQIRGEAADPRSDVYSLGCVFFHCLTGVVPFPIEDGIAKIYAHLNESPPRPTEVVDGLPRAVDDVVARAMAKDPDERFGSAGELGRAALTAAASREDDRQTVAKARPRPRRRLRPTAVVAIAAAAAAGVGAAFLLGDVLGGDGGKALAPRAEKPSNAPPDDGTLVREDGTGTVYLLNAGAKFALSRDQRAAFGYRRAKIRTMTSGDLAAIPDVPAEGSLVRAHNGTIVWSVRDGNRHLADPVPSARVAVIPRSGLLRVPPPPGGRHTSTTVTAPTTIVDGRTFLVIARVASDAGVPKGRCVFYRVALSGLKERANRRARDGRCEAHLRIGGVARVRYSVHFIGTDGWRGSTAVTPRIPVAVEP